MLKKELYRVVFFTILLITYSFSQSASVLPSSTNNSKGIQSFNFNGYSLDDGGTVVNDSEICGVWTKDNSPYYITNNISIKEDSSLIIEAGVTVLFDGPYTLLVDKNCQLLAKGIESDTIKFVSVNQTDEWAGIKFFYSSNDDSLLFCKFSDFKNDIAAGGVFFISNSSTFFKNCLFENNHAQLGGAVYFTQSSPEFRQAQFINNTAIHGGAVYSHNSTSDFFQSLFVYNVATKDGAAIFAKISNLNLNNVTVSDNLTDEKAGALHFIGLGKAIVQNSIFSSNFDDRGNGPYHISLQDRYAEGKSTVELIFNCFDSIDDDAIYPGYYLTGQPENYVIWGNGNVATDPLFVDPDQNDFHLQSESPCIDAGDPDTKFLDEPFPHGFCINLGAYGGTKEATEQHHPRLMSFPNKISKTLLSNSYRNKMKIEIVNGSDKLVKVTDIALSDSTFLKIMGLNEQFLQNAEYVLSPGVTDAFNLVIDFGQIELLELHESIKITVENGEDLIIPIDIQSIAGTGIDTPFVSGVWSRENSPYIIYNDIQISENETLKIEPGVSVVFNGDFNLTIPENTQLVANGTESDSIRFVAKNDDSGWQGLYFSKTSNNDTLKYCHISGIQILKNSYSYQIGAITIKQSSPVINHCLITNNDIMKNADLINISNSNALIKYTTITSNSNIENVFALINSSHVILDHILLFQNSCKSIFNTDEADFELINSVVYGNSLVGSLTNNQKQFRYYKSNTILNSIIYNNPDVFVFNTQYLDTLTVNYSALDLDATSLKYQGNQSGMIRNIVDWGIGNLNSDPKFVNPNNGNFILNPASPCVDAGDPAIEYQDINDPANHGKACLPAKGTARNDMGYYGGNPEFDFTTAIDDADQLTIPEQFALMQNYPNPFNGNTLIEFHLPVSGNVKISVYNIQGQKVKTITESRYSSGVHTLLWDGTSDNSTLVSSGIYLYRILLDDHQSITKRLVFLK